VNMLVRTIAVERLYGAANNHPPPSLSTYKLTRRRPRATSSAPFTHPLPPSAIRPPRPRLVPRLLEWLVSASMARLSTSPEQVRCRRLGPPPRRAAPRSPRCRPRSDLPRWRLVAKKVMTITLQGSRL
jgi:hypothetical protein